MIRRRVNHGDRTGHADPPLSTVPDVATSRERAGPWIGPRWQPSARPKVRKSRFQESPEIIQSVLSGNIKPNAIARLSVFGLDSYIDFEVGGYGSDNHVPGNLIGLARERAWMKYGVQLGKAETVLIGSTLRDVRTGLNGGAHVVSIATGPDSMDALHSAGADIVLPDLRDTDAVAEAVTSTALKPATTSEDTPTTTKCCWSIKLLGCLSSLFPWAFAVSWRTWFFSGTSRR